jgi:hypothetical protein
MIVQSYKTIAIAAANLTLEGGSPASTLNLDETDLLQYYVMTTAGVSLSSSLTIAYGGAGTPPTGMVGMFFFPGGVTLGVNTFTIFGYALSATEALKGAVIAVVYDGSAFKVSVLPAANATEWIETGDIAALAVTNAKIASGIDGSKVSVGSMPADRLAAASITNAQLATMPTLTIKGNNTGGASTPIDLTAAQVWVFLGGQIFTAAAGTSSFVQNGSGSTAAGNYAGAVGQNNVASGLNSFAQGNGNTTSGARSSASGNANVASGSNSRATGDGNTASGTNSRSGGTGSVASGTNSFAYGESATASGNNSFAQGEDVTASREGEFARNNVNTSVLRKSADNLLQSVTTNGTPAVMFLGDSGLSFNVPTNSSVSFSALVGAVQDVGGGGGNAGDSASWHLTGVIKNVGGTTSLVNGINFDTTLSRTIRETGTAQNGSSGSITLQVSATTVTDAFKRSYIYIISGTGAGQSREIIAYNGTTKVATVTPNWGVNPDNTSVYRIVTQEHYESRTIAWDVNAVANNAADTLDITVTGEAGKNIVWYCRLETIELGF